MAHAIIVGAGVSGLATAIALRRIGWKVTVHEQAPGLPGGGTALGMWPEAMRALDRLGVGDRIRREAAYVRGGRILDPGGRVIARIPQSRGAHLISRGRLLSALRDEIPGDGIHWNRQLDPDAPLPIADLIVGADGIHSVIRARTWNPTAERPLGTVAFRGVVDLPVASVSETWGRGALFGVTPTDDGRANWFACIRRDRLNAAPTSPRSALETVFGGWHARIGDVLSRIDDGGIDRRTLFDVSLSHPYVRKPIVLVGDAAHAMAPNLGRGACESLIDAVTLAEAIDGRHDLVAALHRYDRRRRARTRGIVATARMLNRTATAERGVRLRNRAISLLSPER
ncbi:MAG TPA: FAD-dependent monooxygenase [Microbacterium sp.]|nr:FAD-dependent monooxygenase [Microbacterium sp.]